MKISQETITLLKNFATINNSIHIDEELKLKTKTPNSSNIIGIATIEEEFPKLSIYSLDELLGSMSLFDGEVNFKFTDSYIKMSYEDTKINYRLSDPDHILTKLKEAKKYEEFSDFDSTFKITEAQLSVIQKASRVLKADAFCINMEDGKGKITLINSELPMSNSFELKINGEGTGEAKIFVDNLLILSSDYTVNISSKVVKFTSDQYPVFYMLAVAVLN